MFQEDENDKTVTVKDEEIKYDLRAITNTMEGSRFVKRLLNICSIFTPLPINDPLVTAYLEGRRQVGLEILYNISNCNPRFLNDILKDILKED